ncbi:MAG: GAF domain-containing protein [Candidatus Tectomicrobia bacterium]|nr:GAF domain-containing protein [Candidatus Tectomicrobia bacterium]
MSSKTKHESLGYKASLIFALTSVIPILLFIYVLNGYNLLESSDVRMIFGISVIIALLGFVFFRQMVKQISDLTEEFLKLESGEITELNLVDAPQELSEMARIAESFRHILEELKANTKELENLIFKLGTLSELTELVARIPNIQDVLQVVLGRAMTTVQARIGSIMLLDARSQTLQIAAAQGLTEEVVRATTLRLGEGIAGKVAQTGEPMLVADVEHDDRTSKSNDPKYETSSFICMPLRVQDRIIGVLNLAKKGNQTSFSESDLKFINTLLSHIGFAVENARLLKEAREAARQLQHIVEEKTLQLDQTQQQVLQAAKLSAIGQLVAGVAHELNNPLTTVMGYSQLLASKVPDDLQRDIEKIFTEAQRAAKIVQNLLSFSRQQPPEKRLCDVNEILRKVADLCAAEARVSHTELVMDLSEAAPAILVDAHQIQQVLLNVMNNSLQELAEKDGLHRITVRSRLEEDRLQVEIADTGGGISAENMERIFNPFFTTKEKGKGTGLGLSISYGIVQAHGGTIYARNNGEGGASFFVELPLLTGQPQLSEGEQPAAPAEKSGAARILVVEEEENINELISVILKREGYRVDAVYAGDHGLKKLREGDYDLVIFDLWATAVPGRQLYETLKAEKPHLCNRIIFSTGEIINEATQAFLQEAGCVVLQKPFTKEVLVRLVDQEWQRAAC